MMSRIMTFFLGGTTALFLLICQSCTVSPTSIGPDIKAFAVEKGNTIALFIMDIGSGASRQLFAINRSDEFINRIDHIAIAPSGDQIAFTSGGAGDLDIFLLNRNGGEPKRITHCDKTGIEEMRAGISSLSWTMQKQLVYVRGTFNGKGDIYTVDPTEGVEINLTNTAPNERDARPSPTRREILFIRSAGIEDAGAGRVMLINTDGTSRGVVDGISNKIAVNWSPDGEMVAYVVSKRTDRVGQFPNDLGISNRDGSANHIIVKNFDCIGDPIWSPSGERIAIETKDGICVVRRDGSDYTIVSRKKPIYGSLFWNKITGELSFLTDEDGRTRFISVGKNENEICSYKLGKVTTFSCEMAT